MFRARKFSLAAFLVVAMLLVGCTTIASGSAAESQADAVTAARISAALNADPVHYVRHVDVHVYGGVVHLSGYIWSTDALYKAKEIAAAVPGVTRVINEMELERQGIRGGVGTGSG